MSADEEKKEITVKAPSKPVVSPEKKAEKAAEKSLEEERFGVLQIPKRVSQYLSVISMGVGILFVCLSAYMSLSGQTIGIVLSSEAAPLSIAIWAFAGLISVVIGFLLMGRE